MWEIVSFIAGIVVLLFLFEMMDLPELITDTQDAFEAQAVALATDPDKLRAVKQKLETNRSTSSLFDARLFARNVEDAYMQMLERHVAQQPPDHLFVG